MGRKQIYYPANQVVDSQFANEGEFIDALTFEPYVGPYFEANGQYLTGTKFSEESRMLKLIDGPIGEKFRHENTTEYYRLTQAEFSNHEIPVAYWPEPDAEDYETGQFQRYFAQKKNEPSVVIEIDREQYINFNRQNRVGIDSRLYHKIEIRWQLTGNDAIKTNEENIQITNRYFPGFSDVITNAVRFVLVQDVEERTYTDGEVISPNLPQAYGISQELGQECKNCKFRHNNYCSYWKAQIRNEFWCGKWKQGESWEKTY